MFGDRVEIIAAGGVDAPDKALRLLDAGATAVGDFTGCITRGPIPARQILEALRRAPDLRTAYPHVHTYPQS